MHFYFLISYFTFRWLLVICDCLSLFISRCEGQEDIIDETLSYFRANVLFRNFDVRGGGDRTLIYLTLFTVLCLVKCEKIEDRSAGE